MTLIASLLILAFVGAPNDATPAPSPSTQPTSQPTTTGPATMPTQPAPHPLQLAADAPWWVRDGLVIASVEDTLADRAWRTTQGRTREPTYNEREDYVRERNDQSMRELYQKGITLVLMPYGGFGPDSIEAEDRRLAKATIDRCHRLGFHAGVWLPIGQIDPAVWESTEPAVRSWLVHDATGAPIASTFRGRFYTSFAQPALIDRAKRLAREAVEQAGADAVFVPDWRCAIGFEPAAVAVFREFLQSRWPADDATRKSLLAKLDSDGLPVNTESPLTEPWAACRLQVQADVLHEVAAAARAVRRDVLVGVDTLQLGRHVSYPGGLSLDPGSLLQGIDVAVSALIPRVSDRGDISHQIVELKAAGALGARPTARLLSPPGLAQQFAFGGDSAGFVFYYANSILSGDPGSRQQTPVDILEAAHAYRRRRELSADMSPAADVIVYLPPAARRLPDGPESVAQLRAQNALVTHRVPFTFEFADVPQEFPRDAAVLVAGVPSLTEDQAASLRAHVTAGGGLLVIGNTIIRDSAGKRVAADLATYLGGNVTSAPGRAEATVRQLGTGRIVSIDRPGPPANIWLTAQRNAHNRGAPMLEADEFAMAIRSALGRRLSVEGTLPRGAAVELTRSRDGRRTVLHVVRFDRSVPIRTADLQVRLPDPGRVEQVLGYTFKTATPALVSFKRTPTGITISSGTLDLYTAFLIE